MIYLLEEQNNWALKFITYQKKILIIAGLEIKI